VQRILSISALPWSIKPLYGLCSDAWSIQGMHRKPYLVIGAAVGFVSLVALAALAAAVTNGTIVSTRLVHRFAGHA
jgi:hypothetical protein